ncbi:MAG: glycosyltransferase, partial [Candidatus Omnitrophota bacterium]
GLLVLYGDIKGLAEAIENFIADAGNARRMGASARKRVEELFSIEKHVISVQKLYEEVKG